jgi:hypothetical protein
MATVKAASTKIADTVRRVPSLNFLLRLAKTWRLSPLKSLKHRIGR